MRNKVIDDSRKIICNSISDINSQRRKRVQNIMNALHTQISERTDSEFRPDEIDGGAASFDEDSGWF